MVVMDLLKRDCIWRTLPSTAAKRTLRWCTSKSTSRGLCNGDVTLTPACGQTRGEDTPMLTCSGCRVARFCSADHQKVVSKKTASGGSLTMGRHKDICGVLEKCVRLSRTAWILTCALRTSLLKR
jgi:hypothetical protein